MFIALTAVNDHGGGLVLINAWLVFSVRRSPGSNFTVVKSSDGVTHEVTETPQEIMKLIDEPGIVPEPEVVVPANKATKVAAKK